MDTLTLKHMETLRVCTHICCLPKRPKFSNTQNVRCNQAKIQTKMSFHREICQKSANRMTNSVDPDQTAPKGAVLSGSALFAKACLSVRKFRTTRVIYIF